MYVGDSALLPTSADFLKIKVEEKQKMLERDIEEGKQKIQEKRLKEVGEKKLNNPYERLV